jgi:hypothetical protein
MSLDLVGWAVRAVAPLRSDAREGAQSNLEAAATIGRDLATGRDPARSFSLASFGSHFAPHGAGKLVQHNGRAGTNLYCIPIPAIGASGSRRSGSREPSRVASRPYGFDPSRKSIWRAPRRSLCHFTKGPAPRAGKGKARQGAPAAGSPRSSASRCADRCADPLVPRGPLGG